MKKNVGGLRLLQNYFDIAMEYVHAMQLPEALDDLNEDTPDL